MAVTRHQTLLADPLFGAAYRAGFEGRDCPEPPNGGDGFLAAWMGSYEDGKTRRRLADDYRAANPGLTEPPLGGGMS